MSTAEVRQAGPEIERVAAAAIGGHRAVISDNGLARHADKDTPDHSGRVRGISANAAEEGATVRIQVLGPMADPSFSWTPGLPIFVGADGHLTQTAPTSGWLQQVAVAETATRIFIDLRPPVYLI